MKNILKNDKVCFFAIGALAATVGVKFLASKTFRGGCVKAIAGGMKMRDDATSCLTKMKEEAQDICFDAKMESGLCDDEAAEE